VTQFLGPTDIRILSERLGFTPNKRWGQNFVVDAGTVRRIARIAGVVPGQHVIEVGPGLGSLTLALLDAGARVTAIEIDPMLARELPTTVAERAPGELANLTVIALDAMRLTPEIVEGVWDKATPDYGTVAPTALVSNLPYNVGVPVIIHALEVFASLTRFLVMIQSEVADRIVAPPGSRTYGIPSAKVAWFASARRAGDVGRAAFWPVPRVDSALVLLERRDPPPTTASRSEVFRVVDAAFAQRRKGLRGALSSLAGSATLAEDALRRAGIDPLTRGERLGIADFARIAETLGPFSQSSPSGTVKA
jgi:16S rRNA (adenine1518-N6/adenine1519-N6)-dimethyltransferase